uniref:Trimethylguanosine synthase n=1 Tax=Anopheles marajoara TaxID=58244 RepID=A0A2M4BB55_9DIPT
MSASEGHWEPLAEIYLSHPSVKNKKKCIYCLCSRVFIKNYYDVYASTLERGDSVPQITSMDTPTAADEHSSNGPSPAAASQPSNEARTETPSGGGDRVKEKVPGGGGDEPLDVLDRAEVDDVFIEQPLVKQLSFGRDGSRKLPAKWGDREPSSGTVSDVSCYFSASASHSDTNYCSTDEHEHVFYASGAAASSMVTGPVGIGYASSTAITSSSALHSSDSGADLSERHHTERKHSLKDQLLEANRTNHEADGGDRLREKAAGATSGPFAPVERNNSLPDAFGREDLHDAWEMYWSKHGEAIIWASWIEKYSDYINPQYLEPGADQGQATGTNTPHDRSEATPGTATEADRDFSFDHDAIASGTEIVVSACSPHPYNKSTYQMAAWPTGGSGSGGGGGGGSCGGGDSELLWSTHRAGSVENDTLLSPRCDSVTSSIPLTIGTTDSMTNVTRMTISSYDFCSSKVSSESSRLSGSLGSSDVSSSSESSNSSELLETEYLVGARDDAAGEGHGDGAIVPLDEEAAMDGEQYWQILWQQHFQELYAKQYHRFMAEHANDDPAVTHALSSTAPGTAVAAAATAAVVPTHGECSTKHHKRKRSSNAGGSGAEKLPEMVASLTLAKAANDGDGDGEAMDGEDEKNEQKSDCAIVAEDLSASLAAYGLPTTFGKQTQPTGGGNGGGGDRPPNDKPITLKRSHESDTEETPKERLKAAFELMGYAFSDPANDTESIINISGEVVYRKKHIRLHNRVLKMKHYAPQKHTYFDDDGNEVAGNGDKSAPEALLHNSSSDDEPANLGNAAAAVAAARTSVRSSTILDLNQLAATGASSAAARGELGVDSNVTTENGDNSVVAPVETETQVALTDVATPEQSQVVTVTRKEKKKKRKTKFVASLPTDIANDKSLLKYWYKRFSLFSLFDAGIRLDRESWFSVTPEKVAAHTAERCRSDLIVDAFCGCGGNTIQFAFTCQKVLAIDIDPRKIEMAKHNAAVYGVADRIEFITGDFVQLAAGGRLKADTVFLSPPWGGPSYMKDEVYDLEKSLLPLPATDLMRAAQQVSHNVVLYLPRNSNTQQLTMLAGPDGAVEIEQNFLDRKLIALTAYYGDLING